MELITKSGFNGDLTWTMEEIYDNATKSLWEHLSSELYNELTKMEKDEHSPISVRSDILQAAEVAKMLAETSEAYIELGISQLVDVLPNFTIRDVWEYLLDRYTCRRFRFERYIANLFEDLNSYNLDNYCTDVENILRESDLNFNVPKGINSKNIYDVIQQIKSCYRRVFVHGGKNNDF